MTNLFVEPITYITVQDMRDVYPWDYDNETDENIAIYIRKAERLVDSLIVSYWEKLDPNQNTIFPTKKDWIPLEVKQATILLANCIWRHRFTWFNERKIQREKRRWNEIEYETWSIDKFKLLHPCMTQEIYDLLSKFLPNENKLNTSTFFRT